MTAEEILDIADHALKSVMKISQRNGKRTVWKEDEKDDARQEAILHILYAEGRAPEPTYGYLYRAATLGIYMWLRRLCRERSVFQIYDPDKFVSSPLYPTVLERLLESMGGLKQLLRGQRIKASALTERHVEADLTFLRLLLAGYSYEEIGFRMTMTRKAVWMLHDTLLVRLQRIAAGEKPPAAKKWTPSEKQLANLQRVNADPEARRRRGEAISRGIRARRAAVGWRTR